MTNVFKAIGQKALDNSETFIGVALTAAAVTGTVLTAIVVKGITVAVVGYVKLKGAQAPEAEVLVEAPVVELDATEVA